MFFGTHIYKFLLSIYIGVELLNCLCSALIDTLKQLINWFLPNYIPSNNI
jgi:hypothetical protein